MLLDCKESYESLSIIAAAMPAVSERNRVSPNETGMNLFLRARSISLGAKSPSGPIQMSECEDAEM